jgi:hypothetical protein
LETILYVETNFAVGIAKGQDPDATDFLEMGIPDNMFVFPGVCFIEAFATLSFDTKQKRKLYEQLGRHAREVRRDRTSWQAAHLAADLEESILRGEKLLRDTEARLRDVLHKISIEAEEVIDVAPGIIQECSRFLYLTDPTDNLILCCVLWHARRHPDEPKAFFSANHSDFGQPGSVETLKAAGVRYFKDIKGAIGWLGSQSPSGADPAPPT